MDSTSEFKSVNYIALPLFSKTEIVKESKEKKSSILGHLIILYASNWWLVQGDAIWITENMRVFGCKYVEYIAFHTQFVPSMTLLVLMLKKVKYRNT